VHWIDNEIKTATLKAREEGRKFNPLPVAIHDQFKVEEKNNQAIKPEAKKPGTVLWEFVTGDQVNSSPAIGSDGTVYVGSDDKKLYAINGKTGVKLWEFETGGYVYSSPAIGSDGTVYAGSMDNKLYAINGKTGVKLWEFETGGSEYGVHSSPAIGSDGTVYVGSGESGTRDKYLYAINGKSGVKLWEFETGGAVGSSPAIGPDGTVYVGSADKKLYAIKTDSKGPAKSPWPMRGQNARHTGRVMKK
jgi:outer membrane protein assembly factor BamB